MNLLPAGLLGAAALGAQAQAPVTLLRAESVVVTAHRGIAADTTLRDATLITRDDIEAAGALSLGELLERRAGLELRSLGGPGQPQSLFMRGASPAQTLVLVDGLRVGSATQGTTALENIPLEMIERIEVVRGPMSSLYGPEAAGGVIQIFTRGKSVPHLFASAGYGSERDRRASAGLATVEKDTAVSLAAGVRRVDAASATTPRAAFVHDPDRDPHENGFATLRVSHTMWQGETLTVEAFGSRSRTSFDSGPPFAPDTPEDRSEQSMAGVRLTSSNRFADWWSSKLSVGQGRDELRIHGQFPARFETRQDQASWINELASPAGLAIVGVEALRQRVLPEENFASSRREVHSGFASIRQSAWGQRVEAAVRRDVEDQFGKRDTGSASYGFDWPGIGTVAVTYARGFRAPTFNDLYGPEFEGFYRPNPDLRPERSRGREVALRSLHGSPWRWRITHFDTRLDDLIVFSPAAGTMLNVSRARIRGVEGEVEGTWLGVRLRAVATVQRPRNEDSGTSLPSRAERFGSLEASRTWGALTVGVVARASGRRFDSGDESPGSRLAGYGVVDARLRYVVDKFVTAELTAANLGDRRYESAAGYEGRRRGVFLNVRFEAF